MDRLMRSNDDRMIGGVCGGLAQYFNIDPVVVRVVFALSVFVGGVTPFLYVLLWAVMPQMPQTSTALTISPAAAAHASEHPRGVEEWKFDPYTGEQVRK